MTWARDSLAELPEFELRAYRSADRDSVRRIAFLTGYMGEPVDWLWRDAPSFADLITRYYTDREPESLFVADRAGEVVGYLTGCVESARARGSAARESSQLMRRGALLWPGVAGFLWRSMFDVMRDRRMPDEVLCDPRWPAHLHIDLLPEARGRGVGRRLMGRWLGRLRELGSAGVHLGTFAENRKAIGFFEACGFRRFDDPIPAPGFRTRAGQRMHAQWMVLSLDEPRAARGAGS